MLSSALDKHEMYLWIGLQKYSEYNVTVAAQTEHGSGPHSTALTFRTLEDGMFLFRTQRKKIEL